MRELEQELLVEEVDELPKEKEVIKLGTSREGSSVKPFSRKGKRVSVQEEEEEVINVSEKAQMVP